MDLYLLPVNNRDGLFLQRLQKGVLGKVCIITCRPSGKVSLTTALDVWDGACLCTDRTSLCTVDTWVAIQRGISYKPFSRLFCRQHYSSVSVFQNVVPCGPLGLYDQGADSLGWLSLRYGFIVGASPVVCLRPKPD